MRKVLLRFLIDDLWRWQSVNNELLIGAGYLLLFWLVAVAIVALVTWRQTGDTKQVVSATSFWLVIPAAIIAIRILDLPVARSGVPVFGYGFMMFIGFTSASWLASRRVQRVGLPGEVIWDMMMWALVPGLIGARVIYLLQHSDRVFQGRNGIENLISLIALWDGGLVFYGSVFGGIVGVLLYGYRRKISPLLLLDVIGPSMFIGEGFGRIGCFLYGCCWGRACSLPWAVHFPPDSLTFNQLSHRDPPGILPDASATIGLHPTQLYSSAMAFLIAGALAWAFRRRTADGMVLAMGLILYPINRYILETFRDDEPGRLGTSQTFSQLVSVALLLAGIGMLFYFRRYGRLTPFVNSSPAAASGVDTLPSADGTVK
ncbi:MAG: prolipoprotein diacylglyceryl transferase [Planctomycetaceae bacterium]|nr:prolipoprotein diacylglyceryl transferase [Planctomycetaceae bacterium]